MNVAPRSFLLLLGLGGILMSVAVTAFAQNPYPNFETAPAHPVELGPDGNTLAVCHLADNRLLLFDVSSGVPVPAGSVRVGHDPTAVRFRTATEAWVVNHISSNLTIVDVSTRQMLAILPTRGGPSDLVFAGDPVRAYISCTRQNVVQVFDPVARTLVAEIPILGDRPKALSVSPDGSKVYAAILESGNATTILAPELTDILAAPTFTAVSDPDGPYGGQDPPPNSGANFDPPINPHLEPTSQPKGSLIVRKNAGGLWMDDNNGDWTAFISGAKASRTGRVPGWDMPDRDLAVIDTTTHAVSYATGLMNICMAAAVNPASGKIAVVGTEALNHIRFEPKLKSVFLRVNIALVDPLTLTKTIHDLNPHLDYGVRSIPQVERDKSLGDPRGIVWNSAGTRGYVTGMGSRNLIVIDASGQRVQAAPVDLGEGPTGLALDEARNRLHVFNRFSGSLSSVDTNTLAVVATVPFADPTPEFIRAGRRVFFDTRLTSGLGHVSCASCHVDVRFDRLAWDLGVPNGETDASRAEDNRDIIGLFHPMKGPMVTLTLQDIGIDGGEPFHWRGDRASIHDFDITFPDLLGADTLPTPREMQSLKDYLAAVRFPPNLHRTIDNKLPTNLPLPGQFAPPGAGGAVTPLPNGNAQNGLDLFFLFDPDGPREKRSCAFCHDPGSGRGREIPFTTAPRNSGLLFRSPQFRPIGDKLGMSFDSQESRAGFGFAHDGRFDSLSRFLNKGFGLTNPQQIADLIAVMLSFSGGEITSGSDGFHSVNDPPAALGKQALATSGIPPALLTQVLAYVDAQGPFSAIEIVAWQRSGSTERAWLYDTELSRFIESERATDRFTLPQLLALASPANPLAFMAVSVGTGKRVSIDVDEDGIGNLVELANGTDPMNRASPMLPPLQVFEIPFSAGITGHPGQIIHWEYDALFTSQSRVGKTITFTNLQPQNLPPNATFTTAGRFDWVVPPLERAQSWEFNVRITIADQPGQSFDRTVSVIVTPLKLALQLNERESALGIEPPLLRLIGSYFFFNQRYEIQTSDDLIAWSRMARVRASGEASFLYWNAPGRTKRFWRIVPHTEY
jgi:DNA-binding beta-propeller fold protein YncE